MSQETLHREILARSEAEEWHAARAEGCLKQVWTREEPQQGLCGHHPITKVCIIKNNENGKEAQVGNCCVNKFLGLNSKNMFSSVRRVEADRDASFDSASIQIAHKQRTIEASE